MVFTVIHNTYAALKCLSFFKLPRDIGNSYKIVQDHIFFRPQANTLQIQSWLKALFAKNYIIQAGSNSLQFYLNVIIEDIQEFQAFKLSNGFRKS